MDSKAAKWLIEWFETNSDVKRDELLENWDSYYLEMGYIDSFEFISLVSDIEEQFNIQFDNDQFEDRRFSTLSGLAGIIEEASDEV